MRRFLTLPLIVMLGLLAGAGACLILGTCGGVGASNQPRHIDGLRVVSVAAGLDHPWGLAFLPDGRMLITERPGRLRVVDAQGQLDPTPITGLPVVQDAGQGGLLDVAIDPDYATQPWIYWTYAEPGHGDEAGLAGTAVARGQLADGRMTRIEVLYRQVPKVKGTGHFGSRLVFARDKTLFVTLGERQQDSPARPTRQHAQNVAKSLGKVVRILRDGSIPPDNPRFEGAGALPELWSIGHRNPQGAALHPTTGALWLHEHGPQGGDEVNLVLPGRNYGWPLVSYGCPYGSLPGEGCQVQGGSHAPTYEEPLTTWTPFSIAPSGMAFNTGTRYPGWQGQLFIGALAGEALWRLTLDGNKVVAREPLLKGRVGRIRDVRLGPDGWLYLLTDSDDGRLLRLER